MKTERKPLGKTLRFNIFKRDFFKCQYCGSTPPAVVLEIDHIIPVSKGGDNNELNLITSCFDCNRGKRDALLTTIPNQANIELIKEKEAQYLEYQKLLRSISKRYDKEIDTINTLFIDCVYDYGLSEKFKKVSLKMFLEKLGFETVKDSMLKAIGRDLAPTDTIKYFCGICHNIIRNR